MRQTKFSQNPIRRVFPNPITFVIVTVKSVCYYVEQPLTILFTFLISLATTQDIYQMSHIGHIHYGL